MRIEITNRELALLRGDITTRSTDALVNAANSSLMGGGGVDGAIHRAGGPSILAECKQIIKKQGRLPTGKAVITTGGNLKAKYVIHAVGPIWHGGKSNESELLASCYKESLKLAEQYKLHSISFPSISTGAYRYPAYEAAKVALKIIISFLKYEAFSVKEIAFILYDSSTFDAYRIAFSELQTE